MRLCVLLFAKGHKSDCISLAFEMAMRAWLGLEPKEFIHRPQKQLWKKKRKFEHLKFQEKWLTSYNRLRSPIRWRKTCYLLQSVPRHWISITIGKEKGETEWVCDGNKTFSEFCAHNARRKQGSRLFKNSLNFLWKQNGSLQYFFWQENGSEKNPLKSPKGVQGILMVRLNGEPWRWIVHF